MKTSEIRRENLRWLYLEYSRKIVTERVGLKDGGKYVDIVLSNAKRPTNIGEQKAIDIEEAFPEISTEPGWVSVPQWPADERSIAKREIDKLPESAIAPAIKVIRMFGVVSEGLNKGNLDRLEGYLFARLYFLPPF